MVIRHCLSCETLHLCRSADELTFLRRREIFDVDVIEIGINLFHNTFTLFRVADSVTLILLLPRVSELHISVIYCQNTFPFLNIIIIQHIIK